MDKKISDHRVYCKIRAQLGFPPIEIHADLQNSLWEWCFKICYSLQVGASF